MENNISYIPMEPAFQQALRERYTKPFRKNMTALITSLLLVEIMIITGQMFFSETSATINFVPVIVVSIGFFIVFLMAYPKFKKMNIHYLDDANFGQIVKEQTHITKVFDTPAGINIYWLHCAAIKTFTPDPYRLFYEGDVVTIYYLKYSQDYLAYEI